MMAPAVVMIVAAVVSAVAAVKQGQAAKAAADYNAKIADQNAVISRENAARQAEQARRAAMIRQGAIEAAQGKSGGDMQGSVIDVLGDVAGQGEIERQNILYQGELQARGYGNTATLEQFSGKTAQEQSYYKAGGELLKGASSAYGSYNSGAGAK